ncbi:hypothetical protein YC2023_037041 [Brassica napus]
MGCYTFYRLSTGLHRQFYPCIFLERTGFAELRFDLMYEIIFGDYSCRKVVCAKIFFYFIIEDFVFYWGHTILPTKWLTLACTVKSAGLIILAN